MKRCTTIILILLVVSGALFSLVSCGGGSSGGQDGSQILSVTHSFQCDSVWANDVLGDSKTICDTGSLVSCLAMMMGTRDASVNAGSLNAWLQSNGGYIGNNVFLNAIESHPSAAFTYNSTDTYDLDVFKSQIDIGVAVPVQVQTGSHFVVVFGYENNGITAEDFMYYDPADGTGSTWSFDGAVDPSDMILYE